MGYFLSSLRARVSCVLTSETLIQTSTVGTSAVIPQAPTMPRKIQIPTARAHGMVNFQHASGASAGMPRGVPQSTTIANNLGSFAGQGAPQQGILGAHHQNTRAPGHTVTYVQAPNINGLTPVINTAVPGNGAPKLVTLSTGEQQMIFTARPLPNVSTPVGFPRQSDPTIGHRAGVANPTPVAHPQANNTQQPTTARNTFFNGGNRNHRGMNHVAQAASASTQTMHNSGYGNPVPAAHGHQMAMAVSQHHSSAPFQSPAPAQSTALVPYNPPEAGGQAWIPRAPNFNTPPGVKRLRSAHLNKLTEHPSSLPTIEQALHPDNFPFMESALQARPAVHGVIKITNVS